MKSTIFRWSFIALIVGAIAGCGGGGGGTAATTTPTTPTTPTAGTGVITPTAAATATASTASVETCSTCHGSGSATGPVAKSGADHQTDYNQFYQDGVLVVVPNTMAISAPTATSVQLTFQLKENGANFDCTKSTASTSDFSIGSYWASYDAGTNSFPDDLSLIRSSTDTKASTVKAYNSGTNVCTITTTLLPGSSTLAADTAIIAKIAGGGPGIVQIYGVDGILTRDSVAHLSSGKWPFAGVLKVGAVPYTSNANVTGCESCHTKPFLKHTYIYGTVTENATGTATQFYTCKGCHYDQRTGGHQFWQILADNPARAVEVDGGSALTAAEKTKYAYKAKLMNDVHMSHAMEFPYPQSMKNCATCHAGKLAGGVLDDTKFVAETCISCHSVDGLVAKMKKRTSDGAAITIHDSFVADLQSGTNRSQNCQACHSAAAGFAPTISKIHNGGYNPLIYADATGTRYSTGVTVTIDSATVAANVLTIDFSASTTISGVDVTKITPTVLVGLYGYGTKDFIVGPHLRDIDTNRNLEYVVGATHPRFKTVTAAGGKWQVTADLSPWAGYITDGTVKRAEIAVLPQLKNAAGNTVGLNAPSKTFDLTKNAFDTTFFSDIVKVTATGATGCNSCHDQLATTFHSGNRGGNIRVCRLCHESSSAGSHLEMQSRAIDSYVHAIHSFQEFDTKNIDFSDPVAAFEYTEHIGTYYPKFGIKDCESCHNAGKYGVPDPAKSLPAVTSASYTNATWTRSIGSIPSYVVGPASRACGSCHRAQKINADDAGGLVTFNAHTKANGYLYDYADTLWNAVVAKVMAPFK